MGAVRRRSVALAVYLGQSAGAECALRGRRESRPGRFVHVDQYLRLFSAVGKRPVATPTAPFRGSLRDLA